MCLSVLFSGSLCAFASTDDNISVTSQQTTDDNEYQVQYMAQYGTYNNTTFNMVKNFINITTPSGELNTSSSVVIRASASDVNPMAYYMRDQYIIYPTGDTRMAKKGESITFALDNIAYVMLANDSSGYVKRQAHFNPAGIKWVDLYVYDKNNNGYKIDTYTENFGVRNKGSAITIGATFDNLPCDVYAINMAIVYNPLEVFDNNDGNPEYTSTSWAFSKITRGLGYFSGNLQLEIDDNTSGLLGSIIELVTTVKDKLISGFSDLASKLTSGFSDLASKLSSVISGITNLPSKLWTLIENGLKSLFVPDETFIQEYKNDWDSVLSDRFGAIYQSVDLLIDYVSMIDNNVSKGTITLPSTTINLPDNNDFTFGGYDVNVVPDGFGFLADAVKFAIDVVCSFAVINALKRRFERVMEG